MIVVPLLFVPLGGDLGDWLLRGLAVIGAAALGGFGAGLIVQLSARLTTTRQVPRRVLRLVRIMGAITCGLLVAYALFRSGGPGGGGSGEGGGKDSGKGTHDVDVGKDAATKEQTKENLPAGVTSLHVVVVKGHDGLDYKINGEGPAETFDEVKKRVAFRKAQGPPFERLVIVLYEDSPDKDTPMVRKLKDLATENGLTPEISEPKGKAP